MPPTGSPQILSDVCISSGSQSYHISVFQHYPIARFYAYDKFSFDLHFYFSFHSFCIQNIQFLMITEQKKKEYPWKLLPLRQSSAYKWLSARHISPALQKISRSYSFRFPFHLSLKFADAPSLIGVLFMYQRQVCFCLCRYCPLFWIKSVVQQHWLVFSRHFFRLFHMFPLSVALVAVIQNCVTHNSQRAGNSSKNKPCYSHCHKFTAYAKLIWLLASAIISDSAVGTQ